MINKLGRIVTGGKSLVARRARESLERDDAVDMVGQNTIGVIGFVAKLGSKLAQVTLDAFQSPAVALGRFQVASFASVAADSDGRICGRWRTFPTSLPVFRVAVNAPVIPSDRASATIAVEP